MSSFPFRSVLTRSSRLVTAGILAGLSTVALFGLAPAYAHSAFVSSSPAAGSVVTEQLGTFVITTSDTLLDSGPDSPTTFLQVRGPGATELYYGDGCATVEGATVAMPVQLGEPGEYTVAWGVVSADGHPITSAGNGGDITFTWQPGEGEELGEGLPVPPTCGAVPTASESQSPGTGEPAPSAGAADETSTAAADILWIGAALGVLVVAAAIVVAVLRVRGRSAGIESDQHRGDPPAAP